MNIKLSKTMLLGATAFAIFSTAQAYADTFKGTSTKHPVAVIELYTSQGCSSCPPAEKWLGELEKSGVSSDQAIPLALHVNYWDYIGWKDEFAKEYFTKRQYQYRRNNHSSSVYTPQIMFSGKDVRRLSLGTNLSKLKQQNAVVAFDVTAETNDDKNLNVKVDFSRIDNIAKNSNVVVILAENNMVKDIATGENAGRTLEHQHVVRTWKNMGQIRNKLDLNLKIKPEWEKDNLDLVVIVETPDMQTQQALKVALK